MKHTILVACALLALATATYAQATTPRQVIQQIRQAYAKVRTLKATVQVKTGNERYVSSVQFVRPRQFRIQVTQNGKPVATFVSDGTTFTQYFARDNRYTQEQLTDDPSVGQPLNFIGFASLAIVPQIGEILEDYAHQHFSKVQAKGTQKVGTVPCRVVELTGRGGTMTLFLGQKDGLVYRMTHKMAYGETSEELTTALQVNVPIQQAAFAFKPPANAKKEEPRHQAERDDTPSLKGQEAPDFTLTDMEGNEVSLSSLRGKVVFLDFWATWCPPCKASLPHTQALSQHEKAQSGDLVVLAVNAREELDKVKKFMQDNSYTFRVLMDKEGAVLNAYKVQGIPTFVLIDREGKIAWVQVGFAPGSEKQMEEAVRQALGQ
ncbi:MAG: redoxin family protein [Armatimonadota bacterium]|nr:redoxin family protein [bacterium]MDW8322226.1 redoxin family protein [Armatimonadota bacterium]